MPCKRKTLCRFFRTFRRSTSNLPRRKPDTAADHVHRALHRLERHADDLADAGPDAAEHRTFLNVRCGVLTLDGRGKCPFRRAYSGTAEQGLTARNRQGWSGLADEVADLTRSRAHQRSLKLAGAGLVLLC